jgi:hypothetical protein
MYIGLHVMCSLFFSDFNETWIFFYGFWKNGHISNVTKFRPMGAEFFHADGWMGRQIQTYRQYVANSRFLQNCELVYKPSDLTLAAIRNNCRCNVTCSPWKKIWFVNGTVENKWQQFTGQCQLHHGTAMSKIQLFLGIRGDSFSKLYELTDHCNWDDEYDDISRQ